MPGAMSDDDQGVDAPQEHGVHVNEIGREDAASLGGQDCFQVGRCARRRSIPASCRICHTAEAVI